MKTEIKLLTIDVRTTLTNYLSQLREMSEFMESLQQFDIDELYLSERIEGARSKISTVAGYISDIIGREYLHVEYYGESFFEYTNDEENENN